MKCKTLTDKERAFIFEYCKDYNAVKAYARSYGTNSHQHCYDILKKPEAQQLIKDIQAECVRRFGDIAEGIMAELAKDVFEKDEEGKHNASWQKSVDLLQKQLGLQKQDIKVAENKVITVNIVDEEPKEGAADGEPV